MSEALDRVDRIESPRDFFTLAATHIHWELRGLRKIHLAKKRGANKVATSMKPDAMGGPSGKAGGLDGLPAPRDTFAELSRYLDEIETIPAKDRENTDRRHEKQFPPPSG